MKKLIIILSLVLISPFSFSMSQEEKEACEVAAAITEEVIKLRLQGYDKWEVHQAFYQLGYSAFSSAIDVVYSDAVKLSQGDFHNPQIKKYGEKMKKTCLTGVNHFK